MSDGKLTSIWEEELKKTQSLDELKQKYEEAAKQINDTKALKRIYKVYEKKRTELLLQQYRQLKAELSQKKKIKKRDKAEISVKIYKKWINSRLFTAEHYVAMLQQSKDGLQLLFMRKAKLVENQGYLILENRKLRKAWVLNGEPLLLEKSRFPFGRKFVAVHFVLPDYPYTLNLSVDDKIRQLTLKSLNAPQIVHSIIKTKFFEALARVGAGPDFVMLIIGVVMGIGIGAAIGFGVANANLSHLLAQHAANSTVTHSVTTTTTPQFTIPLNTSKGVSP
ncbi:B277 family protein [Saccharolobus solfataricus]|uniref:B277 family protein n=1 Tax=Saccharolobus solfataricus TaxID=2287 RepID=UPI0001C39574